MNVVSTYLSAVRLSTRSALAAKASFDGTAPNLLLEASTDCKFIAWPESVFAIIATRDRVGAVERALCHCVYHPNPRMPPILVVLLEDIIPIGVRPKRVRVRAISMLFRRPFAFPNQPVAQVQMRNPVCRYHPSTLKLRI